MNRRSDQRARELLREYERDPSPVQTFGPSDRILRQTGHDLVRTAKQTPRGVARAVKAEGLDLRDAASGHPQFNRTTALGKAIGQSTLDDMRHPLRHPGYTLLDLLAIAGAGTAGARAAAVGARTAATDAGTLARNVSAARRAGTRPTVAGAARGFVDANKRVAVTQARGVKRLAQLPYHMAVDYQRHPGKAGLIAYRRGGQAERAEVPTAPRRRYAQTPRAR